MTPRAWSNCSPRGDFLASAICSDADTTRASENGIEQRPACTTPDPSRASPARALCISIAAVLHLCFVWTHPDAAARCPAHAIP